MKKSILILVKIYLAWLILFILAKLLFMACYHGLYAGIGLGDLWDVVSHGMKMDRSAAAYLTALPALIVTLGCATRRVRFTVIALKVYICVASLLFITFITVDTVLYGYWDFKLDATPLFYLSTNAGGALASAPGWMLIAGPLALAILTFGLYKLLVKVSGVGGFNPGDGSRWVTTSVMLLLTALLFVPIRGGFGVATVNPSTAYYSDNLRLNHAAVNPAFNFLYSTMHQKSYGKMFRLLPEADADSIMESVTASPAYTDVESPLLTNQRPDIYLIILESFSNHLFPSLGGAPIAVGLDSLAADGLMMSRFYSSSFRTDRALASILVAFPAQPTTSLMKSPEMVRDLPSIARSLGRAGYESTYYYGGDATFANKKSFLLFAGFDNVVTNDDFDRDIERAKWGVPDGYLFEKALDDARSRRDTSRVFTVVQTLSSHEPFEVPYHSDRWGGDPATNAFAYTDSCATAFVNGLRASDRWDNALVVIVPDHYGCYPHDLDPTDVDARHRVPLIMTGGALARKGVIDTPASQVDIAATLLDAMGIDRSEYRFSRNFLDPALTPLAFMSTPTYTATVDSTGVSSVYLVEPGYFMTGGDAAMSPADSINAAYLQTIYTTLDRLKLSH